ncbi:MAG: hypothetical protein K0S00_4447 [Xanthobacteraceae bacterium]|nr:hypothetical protein [Xanthobacteraceae bacterium]
MIAPSAAPSELQQTPAYLAREPLALVISQVETMLAQSQDTTAVLQEQLRNLKAFDRRFRDMPLDEVRHG